jgi:transcriptional regulator with XRE-family HTH domain
MLFMYQNMRLSSKRTTVAVLRAMLGLSVEEFANLIGKSAPTIRSLESGRLKLSEETARRIANETGISIYWLLEDDPTKEPFVEETSGIRVPYHKVVYEMVQSQGAESGYTPQDVTPALLHATALRHCGDWLPIFAAAQKAGKGDLAVFLLRRFFAEMTERFGADYQIAREASDNSRLTTADGSKYDFGYGPRGAALFLVPKGGWRLPKLKRSPLPPSSGNAHPEGARKSS